MSKSSLYTPEPAIGTQVIAGMMMLLLVLRNATTRTHIGS